MNGLLGALPSWDPGIVGPMNRPNLKYVVRPRTSFEADFTEIFGLSSLQGERVIDAPPTEASKGFPMGPCYGPF